MYQIDKIRNTIICGNALSELKEIPDESIDTIITSPPYWNLRDYGVEPVIWDGGDENCEHEFNEYHAKLMHENRQNLNDGFKRRKLHGWGNVKAGFCPKCNAWIGSLGNEPTIQLYIQHLKQIFAEIKRVLKKTGTVWVNIGDTYSGVKV